MVATAAAPDKEFSLEVRGLGVSFGNLVAVNNVNLAVPFGERRAVIGPNGAGKTTLFNAIMGEIRPTQGKVFYQGTDITRMSTNRKVALGVSRTFQKTTLFPSLTVMDNIFLSLQALTPVKYQALRPRERYRQFNEEAMRLLGRVGIDHLAGSPVKDLGHGQQRQVEIMMALAQRPKLLLLDEPTAGLSPGDVPLVTNILAQYEREVTMLLIEHDMEVVFSVVDRITVLHAGEVVAEGTPDEIHHNAMVREIYLGGVV